MMSMIPNERKVSSATLVISVAMHAFFIGVSGVPFDKDFDALYEEERSVIIQIEKPPLLPEIDVLNEESKFEETIENQEILPETKETKKEESYENELIEDIVIEDNSFAEISQNEEALEDPREEEKPKSQYDEKIEIRKPDDEAMLRYQDIVKQRIESHRRYPAWARRQNLEGVSCVVFKLLPDGKAIDIQLVRSSGFSILDNEALSTIKRASPFDPIPPGLCEGSIVMELEIVFKMF
jgi:periplasmic protein TonB